MYTEAADIWTAECVVQIRQGVRLRRFYQRIRTRETCSNTIT